MVWTPTENDIRILRYLKDYREGSRSKYMIKQIPMKRSTFYKRLKILINKNLIVEDNYRYRLSNGEVKFIDKLLKSDKRIWELQNPAIVVKLLEVPKWWNPKGTQMRNKLMLVRGYQFQQVRDFGKNASNPYIQLKNNRHVIQMYPESVIVIFRRRYYSDVNAYDVAIKLTNDFYDFWTWFEERMRFNFFKDGNPHAFLRKVDFNRIRDWMGERIKKRNEKGFVVELGSGRWVKWDLSEPRGRETSDPDIQETMEKDIADKVLKKPMLNSELQENLQILREETTELSRVMLNRSLLSKQLNLRMDEMQGQVTKIMETQEMIIRKLNKK